jgi:hypothetical protein
MSAFTCLTAEGLRGVTNDGSLLQSFLLRLYFFSKFHTFRSIVASLVEGQSAFGDDSRKTELVWTEVAGPKTFTLEFRCTPLCVRKFLIFLSSKASDLHVLFMSFFFKSMNP